MAEYKRLHDINGLDHCEGFADIYLKKECNSKIFVAIFFLFLNAKIILLKLYFHHERKPSNMAMTSANGTSLVVDIFKSNTFCWRSPAKLEAHLAGKRTLYLNEICIYILYINICYLVGLYPKTPCFWLYRGRKNAHTRVCSINRSI